VELWVTDATAEGTFPIDVNPARSSHPMDFTPIGARAFLTADGGRHKGREL
jgi:hypothetical protein